MPKEYQNGQSEKTHPKDATAAAPPNLLGDFQRSKQSTKTSFKKIKKEKKKKFYQDRREQRKRGTLATRNNANTSAKKKWKNLSQITCYNYNKKNHYAKECTKPKN